jgi:hypothetical protein
LKDNRLEQDCYNPVKKAELDEEQLLSNKGRCGLEKEKVTDLEGGIKNRVLELGLWKGDPETGSV